MWVGWSAYLRLTHVKEIECPPAFSFLCSPSFSASLRPYSLSSLSVVSLFSLPSVGSNMASMSSESWENIIIDDALEIDSSLLMDLLEAPDVENTKNERPGSVIQSLDAEIGNSDQVESHSGSYDDCMDYGIESMRLEGDDYLRLASRIDDPFDWVNSHYDNIGDWYLETCTNEIGMVEFGDIRDYYSYGDVSMEHAYSPLWQET